MECAGQLEGKEETYRDCWRGEMMSMLCDMLRWSRRGSWRAGRRLTETAGGEEVSLLCDMLRWSRRGSWRAGRRLTETGGGEEW